MGFFNFLKKLLNEESEEKVTEEIKFENFEKWVDSKIEAEKKRISEKINEIKARTSEEKEKTFVNVSNLENAESKNKEIPDRAKQIMEGNRATFVARVNDLLNKIEIRGDDDFLDFPYKFDMLMNDFAQGAAKSHNVLSEFFPEETAAVSESVRVLDRHVKELKKFVEKSKIWNFEYAKKEFQDVNMKMKRKTDIGNDLEGFNKILEEDNLLLKESEIELESLKNSQEYKNYLELNDEQTKTREILSGFEKELASSFSTVESALKKYEKLSENKKVREYLKNPVMALIMDSDLEIAGLIESIKKVLERNELNLKENKKERAIAIFGKLNKEFFERILKGLRENKNRLSEISSEIEKIEIAKEIEILIKKIDSDKLEILEKEEKIKKMQSERDKIDFDLLKEDFAKSLEKKDLGIEII